MAIIDKTFKDLVTKIINSGYWYDDPYRKGVKRKELSTYTLKHDLTKGFPAITTKDLYWKGVVGELIWFLRGDINIKYLVDNNINIWNKDAYSYYLRKHLPENGTLNFDEFIELIKQNEKSIYHELGDLGRVYSAQWKDWKQFDGKHLGTHYEGSYIYIDQISNLIKGMKEKPLATDLLVTAWNPGELDDMALPPCHFGFQIVGRPLSYEERIKWFVGNYYETGMEYKSVLEGFKLVDLDNLSWYEDVIEVPKYGFTLVWDQRSVDTFLGLPFNISSYALLAHILGNITNMIPLEIVGNLRNVHIYDNAIDAIQEQMGRDVDKYSNCRLNINETTERVLQGDKLLDEKLRFINISDFKLENYESYPPLKVEMLARD